MNELLSVISKFLLMCKDGWVWNWLKNDLLCFGGIILNLGCGIGELFVYLMEFVGRDGKVVIVNFDIFWVKLV